MAIVTVLMKLKIKGCALVFKEGFEPGVIVTQVVDIDIGDEPREPWLSVTLMRCEDEFITREIEVEMEEIHAQSTCRNKEG